MYAVLVKVRIESGRYDDAMNRLRENIVPAVKGAPGFVQATWFGDTGSGHGLMIFESEEQAQQMVNTVAAGPDDPVQIEDVNVYEVTAQA
ncbi:MAG: hypothetical protein M3Q72_07430 [Actinomycetota bacterium]|nr:hypothetical protein [Actinomycetota bacterium]